jgi:hypothetical protein
MNLYLIQTEDTQNQERPLAALFYGTLEAATQAAERLWPDGAHCTYHQIKPVPGLAVTFHEFEPFVQIRA